MTQDFSKAVEETLVHEGILSDVLEDRGGLTKYGISQKSYPRLDIKSLTKKEALDIYYNDFWNHKKLNIKALPVSFYVKREIFDTAVNAGTYREGVIFQEALNLLNRNEKDFEDLKVDGWLGSATRKSIKNLRYKNNLLKTLNGLQFCLYKEIAEKNPMQEVFFNGWLKRV